MLRLHEHWISDTAIGDRSGIEDQRLLISAAELEEAVAATSYVDGIEIDIARPGDSVRISGVIDVIEPRYKPDQEQDTFPGIASRSMACGAGDTLALRNVVVTTVGEIPPMSETFVQEDCLIDMAGRGSGFSPFSNLHHLVVRPKISPRATDEAHMRAIREAGVRASRYLATLAPLATPGESVHYADRGLGSNTSKGNVVYVCSLISEGPLHDTLLYGDSTEDMRPRWLPVTHMVDGALVSSDLHYPNQRTPTYLYQRNPLVEAISARDDLHLAGVILTLRYGTNDEKRDAAVSVAEMALESGADSVIVHPAVGGNAHVDAVDIVEEVESRGLSAVLVLQEMAGAAGADLGLVHFVPEANAMVSTGNRDEIVDLPPLDRVIGPLKLDDGSPLDHEVRVSLRSFLCSTAQTGAHSMTGVAG